MKTGTSGFRGVYRDRRGRWEAVVRIDGCKITVGCFDDAERAAVARDRVLRSLGAPARELRFPARRLAPATIDEMRALARRLLKRSRTSRYLGVYYSARSEACPWAAQIKRCIHLGNWPTERAAAIAYDRAAAFYFGKGGKRNLAGDVAPTDAASLVFESRQYFKKRTTSPFRGVSWKRNQQKWLATIREAGRTLTLGTFADDEEAAAAYDRAARRVFGARAKLNFHPTTRKPLYGKRLAQ